MYELLPSRTSFVNFRIRLHESTRRALISGYVLCVSEIAEFWEGETFSPNNVIVYSFTGSGNRSIDDYDK